MLHDLVVATVSFTVVTDLCDSNSITKLRRRQTLLTVTTLRYTLASPVLVVADSGSMLHDLHWMSQFQLVAILFPSLFPAATMSIVRFLSLPLLLRCV